jgi:hypothetical protein
MDTSNGHGVELNTFALMSQDVMREDLNAASCCATCELDTLTNKCPAMALEAFELHVRDDALVRSSDASGANWMLFHPISPVFEWLLEEAWWNRSHRAANELLIR